MKKKKTLKDYNYDRMYASIHLVHIKRMFTIERWNNENIFDWWWSNIACVRISLIKNENFFNLYLLSKWISIQFQCRHACQNRMKSINHTCADLSLQDAWMQMVFYFFFRKYGVNCYVADSIADSIADYWSEG